MTTDYWYNRANKFQSDIDHIKWQIENDKTVDVQQLREIKNRLVEELMVCREAIDQFSK
mgnify:CR=1 FL=1